MRHSKPYLAIGDALSVSDSLVSMNRRYLASLEGDGSLCVYRCDAQERRVGTAIFSSVAAPAGGEFFVAPQSDGNLCVSKGTPSKSKGALWAITGQPASEGPYHAIVDGYGRLCVYEGADPSQQGRLVHNTPSPDEPNTTDDGGKYKWGASPERWLRQPFFYNEQVHAVTNVFSQDLRNPPKVQTCSFGLSADGTPTGFGHAEQQTTLTGWWGSVATCVYRGQAWLFFDSVQSGDRWRFDIRYKTSIQPAKEWLPSDGGGTATGLQGSYANWGALTPACLGAKELNGKLYLFYYRDEYIYFAAYDGQKWTDCGRISDDHYHPNFSVCSAVRHGEAAIVFAGVPHADEGNLHLIVLSGDGNVTGTGHVSLGREDYVQYNNRFGLAHGSIPGSPQHDVLQVFGNNGGSRSDLRRVEVDLDLEPMLQIGGWVDTTLGNQPSGFPNSFCDVAVAAVPTGDPGDFRQHLVVLHSGTSGWESSGAASYPSDLFRCDHVSVPIVTGSKRQSQPDTWTLVGVIEGIPPFARNDVAGTDVTAYVNYAEGRTQTTTVTHTAETALAMTAAAGGDLNGASVELAASFKVSTEMTRTVTGSVTIKLGNDRDNLDGSKGYLVVCKPILIGKRFARVAYDGRLQLGTFLVVLTDGIDVSIESYSLKTPPPGMTDREASTRLDYWSETTFPPLPKIKIWNVGNIESHIASAEIEASLAFGEAKQGSTEATATATVAGKAELLEMFKLETTASVSYSYTLTVMSDHSRGLTAGVMLPKPDRVIDATVTDLTIDPRWLVPDGDASLSAGTRKPYWLPDRYVSKGLIPWCLSWWASQVTYGSDL